MDRFWRPMTVAQQIIRLIREQPGLTERQIAERIFGDGGSIQRVNPTCRKLVAEGWLERHGRGAARDGFGRDALPVAEPAARLQHVGGGERDHRAVPTASLWRSSELRIRGRYVT